MRAAHKYRTKCNHIGKDWKNAMPFIPVPNTVMVETRMLWASQNVENTLYFAFASAPSVAQMTVLVNAVESWWVAFYAPLASDQVTLREVAATDLTSQTGPSVAFPAIGSPAGELTSPSLPNNCTLAVSFRTALRGRSYRGRNYFCGLTELQVANNIVDATNITNLQDCYEAIFPIQGTANCQWVVVSRHHDNAPRTTGVATPIISVTITDNVIDSQRGRLPGRGT